jgi:hypothetical protein
VSPNRGRNGREALSGRLGPGLSPRPRFGRRFHAAIDALHQLGERDLEAPAKDEKGAQGRCALSAFQQTHRRPVQAAMVGKRFLTQSPFRAQFLDSLCESVQYLLHPTECAGYNSCPSTDV